MRRNTVNCVRTDGQEANVQTNWFRGKWYDGPTVFWRQFVDGALPERSYETAGSYDHATLEEVILRHRGVEKDPIFLAETE